MRPISKHLITAFFVFEVTGRLCHAVEVSSFTSVENSTASVAVSSMPAESQPAVWRHSPNTVFGPGEDFKYVIKWGVVVAGRSNLSVQSLEMLADRPVLHIVSEARSSAVVNPFYKVQDRNEAWIDQHALITLRYSKQIREGKFRIEESSELDQIRHRWKTKSYRIDKDRHEEKEGELPPNVLDAFGSLYYVRTLPLEVGLSYTIDVFSGSKVLPLVINVKKREKVSVPAGKFDCFLVEPLLREPGIFISKGKKLEVWITADERRIPVRMRSEVFIGHVAAELTNFTMGTPPN